MPVVSFVIALLALAIIGQVDGKDFTGKTLVGNVLLPEKLTKLPEGSCMTVKLKDARRADAPSTTMAKEVIRTPELKVQEGKPLLYSVKLKEGPKDFIRYSVSIVITLGWCPEENSGEWIRKGDLLNHRGFSVVLKDCQNDNEICKGPMVSLEESYGK
eukprot:gene3289-3771_t